MHICGDEIMQALMALPIIGYCAKCAVTKLKAMFGKRVS